MKAGELIKTCGAYFFRVVCDRFRKPCVRNILGERKNSLRVLNTIWVPARDPARVGIRKSQECRHHRGNVAVVIMATRLVRQVMTQAEV